MATSTELLVVFAVAWAVSVATLGDVLGFSTEVGAFLAGFALASTPYREAIASSLTGLRDFLLLFFFIELGSQLDFSEVGGGSDMSSDRTVARLSDRCPVCRTCPPLPDVSRPRRATRDDLASNAALRGVRLAATAAG